MPLNYTVKGQGNKNIILLHGWGGSMESLQGLQDELAKTNTYRVYNIELPGFGESSISKGKVLTLDDYVSSLDIFMESNNINKPILVGHSFGGKVALAYTLKKENKVQNLILVNSSGLKPKNTLKKVVLIVPTKTFGLLFSLPVLNKVKSPIRSIYYRFVVRERDYLRSKELQETLKNVLKVNLDDQIGKINVDTLLIWGENDSYTPLWMGERFSKLLPNARLEVIQGAKHNLPLVNPQIVSSMIRLHIK